MAGEHEKAIEKIDPQRQLCAIEAIPSALKQEMKILHTSDWHLGHSLYGRKRYEEFSAFLHWLVQTIIDNQVDALLVAGDIFDSSTPSNRAQELYYRFLHQVARSCCRHTVIIAGNHDSPSFLGAPKELLKALDVHVIANASEDPRGEVLVLRNEQGEPALIVCAVPYLRDRDIRLVESGENIEEKERKLVSGIHEHYAAVGAIAEQKRAEFGAGVPIVGMGHLFTAGGRTVAGDGVRELYVGSLVHVAAWIFPECFDYLALGHLHVPQRVGGSETMRYSGSPLPMGFGESNQQKQVCLIEFQETLASVQAIHVPSFQRCKSITGDWDKIFREIRELAMAKASCWLEIIYEGDEIIGDLRQRLDVATSGTCLEILRVKNNRVIDRVLKQIHEEESLNDLSEREVFERCLAEHNIPEEQRQELLRTYQEALFSLSTDDLQSE